MLRNTVKANNRNDSTSFLLNSSCNPLSICKYYNPMYYYKSIFDKFI